MRQLTERFSMRRLNRSTRSVSMTCIALDCCDAIRGRREDRYGSFAARANRPTEAVLVKQT
jgi:hypothetical protein